MVALIRGGIAAAGTAAHVSESWHRRERASVPTGHDDWRHAFEAGLLAQFEQWCEVAFAGKAAGTTARAAEDLASLSRFLQRINDCIKAPTLGAEECRHQAADQRPMWQVFQEILADVPQSEIDKLPTDGAEQHDHYIYGTPKKAR